MPELLLPLTNCCSPTTIKNGLLLRQTTEILLLAQPHNSYKLRQEGNSGNEWFLRRKSRSTGREYKFLKPDGLWLQGNQTFVTSFQQQWHTPFLSRAAFKGFTGIKGRFIQKDSNFCSSRNRRKGCSMATAEPPLGSLRKYDPWGEVKLIYGTGNHKSLLTIAGFQLYSETRGLNYNLKHVGFDLLLKNFQEAPKRSCCNELVIKQELKELIQILANR